MQLDSFCARIGYMETVMWYLVLALWELHFPFLLLLLLLFSKKSVAAEPRQ